jgi:hypothetical protein
MKRVLLAFLVMCLVVVAASVASAQGKYVCVKTDGSPVAGIILPRGAKQDPSVICNAVVPQCFLTCSAVQKFHDGQSELPPGLPTVKVTRRMLSSVGEPAFESPQYCASQYQNCLANCRGDNACRAFCESVHSGCGTGNSGR